MKISKLLSIAALLLGGTVVAAASTGDGSHNSINRQQAQYKTNAMMIGVGYTNILDT